MDVLTLRTSLESVLVDSLGTYTLSNGATTPAMSVRAVGESMPADTKVSGLEAILVRDPLPEPVPSYRDQKAFLRWTLFLVDWDGTNAPHEAAALILSAYPGTSITSVSVPEAAGPGSQLRLQIRTSPIL